MCIRNVLSYRHDMSVDQNIPENAVELSEDFLNDMKHKGEFSNMASIDETPCYFEIPRSSTFDRRDVSIVKVKTTGCERLHFTVALTAGIKRENNGFTLFSLPTLITFKNLKKIPPGKCPTGIQVLGSKGGTMTQTMMKYPYP